MYLQITHGGAAAISGPRMASRGPPLGGRRLWSVGQRVDCENPGPSSGPTAALAADHGQGISQNPQLTTLRTLQVLNFLDGVLEHPCMVDMILTIQEGAVFGHEEELLMVEDGR